MDKGQVMIIDDDRHIIKVLARILGRDIETFAVDDAESALPLLVGDRHFDAILCDVHMTGLSGPGLRDRLRELAPGRVRRMVFITGNETSELAKQVADHFLIAKPFDSAYVRALVERLIVAGRADYFPVNHGG